MNFELNKSLLPYNTFHIEVFAKYFISIKNETELLEVLNSEIARSNKLFIIGGGSNILLTQDIEGLVILNEMKGISKIYEEDAQCKITFGSGENWHECVLYCIENNLGGIENLSLIPGTVGAAPIQNIGAYGVELKDVFVELEAMNIQTTQKEIFSKKKCAFDYRNSIFKNELKGKYIITSVTLELTKKPIYNTSYGNIQQELDSMKVTELSIKVISDAVIRIRQSKLPDPRVIGNAGSFFKNPLLSNTEFASFNSKFPDAPSFKSETGVKVAAAWLIEHSHPENAESWKGYREGNFGVHAKQALCLINYADAKGSEIFELSQRIITSVQHTFNITLEREVNIW